MSLINEEAMNEVRCEWRRPMFLGSSRMLLALVLLIASFGLALPLVLLIWYLHSRESKQIWIEGERLFDDKHLPRDGLELAAVSAKLSSVSLLGLVTLERGLTLAYLDPATQRLRWFGISQLSFGRRAFEEALRVITTGIAAARQTPTPATIEIAKRMEQAEARQKLTPRRACRAIALLLCLAFVGFAIVLQVVSIAEVTSTIAHHENKLSETQTALQVASHRKAQLEEELEKTERYLSNFREQLWMQRGVQAASALLGLFAMAAVYWLRPPKPLAQ